ncbi:MAG TPA: UDP-N-acetylenolpyruvoylglucosamine reductase [Opitutae bacterium]|nr:UDP-N-acetylenolpyruvoylglucosamine reductase [Opitutae bacterium]
MAEIETYLFIGVGGMGMAPLASWLAKSGATITGYDDHLREPVRRVLVNAGVEVRDILFAEQLDRITTVVYSSAIQASHPLLESARARGLKVLRRGEMLAEISSTKKLIAVVGSHGKTTTTGMIAHGLRSYGIDANFIVGGLFNDPDLAPYHYSESEWLVAEVDESDGTIDSFSPEVTLLLNVDWDHADRYSDEAMIDEAFRQLIVRTQSRVLFPSESGLAERFHETGGAAIETYSTASKEDCFNRSNEVAAIAVLELLGAQVNADLFDSFPGVARRQTCLFKTDSLTVIEDYAHHPTEISALLQRLRKQSSGERLVVVFQPHRYSRTKQFKRAFAESLFGADKLFLLPVYAAHESEQSGGLLEDLVGAFDVGAPECLTMDIAGVQQLVQSLTDQPTTVAFVGAGDLDGFAGVFVEWIRCKGALDGAWFGYLGGRVAPECTLKSNEPLANKTTLRVGGAARFYAEPSSLADLRALLRSAKLFGLEIFCLGRGSNLLVSDSGFDGLVIRFSAPAWRKVETLSNGRIWAAAGGRLKEICGHAAKAGLAGFEFLEGIPGAVGGALRMNAGAMGSWMFDVVERVQYLDETGKLLDLPKDAFHFGYRKVEEISRGIALGAILKSPESGEEASIRSRMDSYSSSRKESQPRAPSAGCIFKNPEGNYAGKLIDTHGIKGMSVGAAEVSDVHGNFIVNTGGATSEDVIELVRRVRAAVYEQSGYILEPEVLLVGDSWDSILGSGLPTEKEAKGV